VRIFPIALLIRSRLALNGIAQWNQLPTQGWIGALATVTRKIMPSKTDSDNILLGECWVKEAIAAISFWVIVSVG
jgi:hypothetical protein